jgi:Amino acid transporters
VLLGFIIVGVLMYTTVLSLGELAIMYPINGAFYEYSVRFIDPAWCVSFDMGMIESRYRNWTIY